MDIQVQQAGDIVLSSDDPWSFAEEVAFGECRYLMRWLVKGHYLAEVAAIDLEPDEDAADVNCDVPPMFCVTVKFDGCCDWRFAPMDDDADDGYVHTCDPEHVAALAGAMVYAQRRGLQVLEAREHDFRLRGLA